jgi:hypothetical protein
MDFLKKNYEKILLGVVLLGLAAAAGYLPFKISGEKAALTDLKATVLNPKSKPLTNLDTTVSEQSLKRVASPAIIDFGAPNRLFNAMPWQKGPDRLVPQSKVGPSALTITNITPLYLRLTLDPQVTPSDSGFKYVINVEKQVAKTKRAAYCKLNDKNDTFQLVEVKGKPEDPSQVVVVLNDTGEHAVITKEKPFERVDGYMADLDYRLENGHWRAQRVGATLPFNGEQYKIVAINQSEVVLSAPNQKKWTIKSNPSS